MLTWTRVASGRYETRIDDVAAVAEKKSDGGRKPWRWSVITARDGTVATGEANALADAEGAATFAMRPYVDGEVRAPSFAGRTHPYELIDARGYVLGRYSDEAAAHHHCAPVDTTRTVVRTRGQRGWAGRAHGEHCTCPAWHIDASGTCVWTGIRTADGSKRWRTQLSYDVDTSTEPSTEGLRWLVIGPVGHDTSGDFEKLDHALAYIEAQLP